MTIRKLLPEEHIHYLGICRTVLWGTQDIRAQMQDPLAHACKDADVRLGAFDETGKLLSAMTIEPYVMRMNSKDVKMGGVAGIATCPEARSRGLVRKIMDVAFPFMIESGQIFSYLFPFSYEYYRRFGYDICICNNDAVIPIAQFAKFPFPKNIAPYEPGDNIADFAFIYEKFTKDQNLAIVRDSSAWEKILDRDPYKNHQFTYITRDGNGSPTAYILYDATQKDGKNISVHEICWTTPQGLFDIFGFLARLSPEYKAVEWRVPSSVNILAVFPNGYDITWTKKSGGMNRILDVTAALSTLRAPCTNDKITIEVVDSFYPINSGMYAVEWEGGNLTVARTTAAVADMSCGIDTLTQLVTGFLTAEECLYKKGTKICSKFDSLAALFPKQKLYMTENF